MTKNGNFQKNFKEIWEIAKFYIGATDVNNCTKKIFSNQGKLFFLCVWITKLENSDNDSEYLYDVQMLIQKNYFELIKIESLLENEKELIDYLKNIPILGIDVPLKNLCNNIRRIELPCNINFLSHHKKEMLNYNTFSYKIIDKDDCQVWQERYLLEILEMSFNERKLQPIFSNGNRTEIFNKKILNLLKNYFNNSATDFVLDSVLYMIFNVNPPTTIKLLHCDFLIEAINSKKENHKILFSSSYHILSCLHKDKKMQDCIKNKSYINFLEMLHSITDPLLITRIKEDVFPISKFQKDIITKFLTNKFKNINNIYSINELSNYLKDDSIIKNITTEYLKIVSKKFKECIDKNTEISISILFYDYMIFLININKSSQIIDKRYIQKEMIYTQKFWQENVYEKQCKNLKSISFKQEFKNEYINEFNKISLLNPIIFAQYCTPVSEEEILNIMISVSENPLKYIISQISLSPIFPTKKSEITFERHDIDKMFLSYVTYLQQRKGYKLLNQLNGKEFVLGIHENYSLKTQTFINFIDEYKLYDIVKKEEKIELLPYSNIISLALLTQLFPILEIKIRELVTLLGIFPFKKNIDEFMQYNDPSSLLRELLIMIFNEQHSFENVADFIFVYNTMYNGNSFNIRNECLHGRNYLSGNNARFAFKVTLFAIHMINFRIKTIKENISDIIDIIKI